MSAASGSRSSPPTRRDLDRRVLLSPPDGPHPLPLHRHGTQRLGRLPHGLDGGGGPQDPSTGLEDRLLPSVGVEMELRVTGVGLGGREAFVGEAEPVEGGAELVEGPGVLPDLLYVERGDGMGHSLIN